MSFDKFWEWYFKKHDVIPEGINKPRAEHFILEYLEYTKPVGKFFNAIKRELKKIEKELRKGEAHNQVG